MLGRTSDGELLVITFVSMDGLPMIVGGTTDGRAAHVTADVIRVVAAHEHHHTHRRKFKASARSIKIAAIHPSEFASEARGVTFHAGNMPIRHPCAGSGPEHDGRWRSGWSECRDRGAGFRW